MNLKTFNKKLYKENYKTTISSLQNEEDHIHSKEKMKLKSTYRKL